MLDTEHHWSTSLKPLVIGLILSLGLTLAAYWLPLGGGWGKGLLLLLGTIQAGIQLVFFLQIGIEQKPRWNLLMFSFMLLLIIVLVGGSLWIMENLDYNMMLGT